MSVKKYLLDEQIPLSVYKIRGSRYLRMSIKPNGSVRISIPAWMPFSAGFKYAQSKQDWIHKNYKPTPKFQNGQKVGKDHIINIIVSNTSSECRSVVTKDSITIKIGESHDLEDENVQTIIHKACIKALRMQAEIHLPARINNYASVNNIVLNSISIKNMRGRWGSCDINKNIVLNLHLMHLPWELIDYVLHHELTHTRVMKHGPEFWNEMRSIWPDVDHHKKAIKNYQPNFSNN